VNQYKHR